MSLPLLHAGKSAAGLSAALDLRFALDKSLTAYRGPTPSFSRASTGSYFDGSGVLRYAALNQVLYSEDFGNAAWVKQNGTISTDQIIAPDGKTTADKFTENVANTFFNIYNSSAVSHSAGATMTASGYFKYGTRRYIQFILGPAAAGVSVVVDLLNGLITATGSSGAASYTSSSITNAGNGWYRVSVTGTLPSANTGYYDLFTSNTSSFVNPYPTFSSSGEYTYIWGAQVETGSTVGTYCPTTSSANSAPRFDHTYNGTSWVSRGLLMEEQRTNSAQYSEDFTNAYWTKAGLSVSGNNANAPDGNLTADKFVETAANSQHTLYNSGFSVTTGTAYIISFFAKAAGRNFIQFPPADVMTGVGSNGRVNFDLSTGTIGQVVGTNLTAEIIDVGNGWYRCVVKLSSAASNGTGYLQFNLVNSATATPGQAYLGDGTSGVLVWGIQLEAGSAFATSYIPSLSNSSTTRSADVCQITGSDFSSFWNASEGSVAVEFSRPIDGSASGDSMIYIFPDSSDPANSQIGAYITSGKNTAYGYGSSAFQYNFDHGTQLANTTYKIATGVKLNDFASSQNGGAVLTDTSGSVPGSISRLLIGYLSWSTGARLNGHIARLRYFNKRLPNATLQQLSEPDPTLNLQFALNKTLTPVAGPAPSFSRASTGTYFNASGVLTSASINTPRFDHVYSGGQWVSRGLLIEEQRTNSLAYSENFSNAYWAKFNSPTLTADTSETTSPDGNNTATKVVSGTTSETDIYRTGIYSGSASITFSIYAKAGTSSFFGIGLNGGGADFTVNFNLSNGTYNQRNLTGYTATSISITSVGNGWYRCSLTATNPSVSTGVYLYCCANSVSTSATTSGNSTYLFGAQFEIGAFQTSYIKSNSGSSVTRSADVCQITGTSFNWMWNQGEGSVVAEWDARRNSGGQFTVYWARDAASSNTVLHTGREALSPPGVRFTAVSGASVSAEIINAGFPDPGVQTKTAGCYKVNDFAYAYNGNLVGTDTLGAVPVNPTDILIGSDPYSNYLNGHIAKLIYYPARLTNTKLQQLST